MTRSSGSWRFAPSPFGPASAPTAGAWLKACFHCHTVNSDGGLSPDETAALYRRRGYDCLGITDHHLVTPMEHLGGNGLVTVDSTENGGDPDIIGVGVHEAVPAEWPLHRRVSALAAQGGFTIAAHPTYCAATPEVYLACPDLMAMEILNAYCDEAYCNGLATELWDMLLGLGKRIWGVAGDDAHLNPRKRYYSDAGRAWTCIWAVERRPAAVLQALRAGAFYASQGPAFESIRVSETGLAITCSPVAQVRWRTFGKAGHVVHAEPGAALTTAQLPEWLQPRVFVRVELVDAQGRKAWSNPFFVEAV